MARPPREIRNGKLRCSKCHKLKNKSEFYKESKYGFQYQCKNCMRKTYKKNRVKIIAKLKEWRLKHPRLQKKRQQTSYKRNKAKILANQKIYSNKPSIKIRKQCYDKMYKQKHTKKHQKQNRSSYLVRKYNMTLEDYNKLYQKQRGKCIICGRWQPKLYVDHDHTTGKVRALLCNECNVGIGCLQDSSKICSKAVKYLKKYGK